MNGSAIDDCLELLKTDLGITTTAYDERLEMVINAAIQAITGEGITLDSNDVMDIQLVVMYSSWFWNKRRNGEGMPRMLRYALNNKLFGKKDDE